MKKEKECYVTPRLVIEEFFVERGFELSNPLSQVEKVEDGEVDWD